MARWGVVLLTAAVLVSSATAQMPTFRCKDPAAKCVVNPCADVTCTPKARWVCLPLYCSKPLPYQGVPVPQGQPCSAQWFDLDLKEFVKCPELPAECNRVTKPVCATNGRSYVNECQARLAGAKIKFQGACSFPTQCNTKKYAPVCDPTTATTWPTACVAKLNGARKIKKGPCKAGPCAACRAGTTLGCNAPHRCKGNKRYKCAERICKVKEVADNGAHVSVGGCGPVYYNAKTAYLASACLKA